MKREEAPPLFYTIQDSFPVLVDKDGNVVGLPNDSSRLEYGQRRFESDYTGIKEVKNAVKIIAKCGLKFSETLPPNCTQEDIQETRQLLLKKLKEELKSMIVDTKVP